MRIRFEIPSGAVNGSNAVFTTSSFFRAGTVVAHLNGLADHGWKVSEDVGTHSFTVSPAPAVGDVVEVYYVEELP